MKSKIKEDADQIKNIINYNKLDPGTQSMLTPPLPLRAKGRTGSGKGKKKVKGLHNPVVEYHDKTDDPYVNKPKLQLPEKRSK